MAKRKEPVSDQGLGLTGDPGIDQAIADAEKALLADAQRGTGPDADPITLGPRVISADEITNKLVTRAADAAPTWLQRVKSPRKHPLVEGRAAEPKYKSKMETVLKEERRKKALEKVTDEDLIAGIDAAGEDAFRTGIERKKGKVQRRMAVLQPLYIVLAKAIDAMPTGTDAEREKKMLAARRAMIVVGKVRRGELGADAIAAEARKLTSGAA